MKQTVAFDDTSPSYAGQHYFRCTLHAIIKVVQSTRQRNSVAFHTYTPAIISATNEVNHLGARLRHTSLVGA